MFSNEEMALMTNIPYLRISLCAVALGLLRAFNSIDHWGGEATMFYLRHGPSSKYQMDVVDDIKDINDEFSEAQVFFYRFKVSSNLNSARENSRYC